MLDIKFIRENAELVQNAAKQKGFDVDIKKLLELDGRRRELIAALEGARARINQQTASFEGKPPTEEQKAAVRAIKTEQAEIEDALELMDHDYQALLKQVPNLPAEGVPVGASEAENAVDHEWGDKPQFDFEPKTHWELAESRGLIDKERAAKVSGSRFAYLKGDLVKLQLAILQFAINILTDEESIKKIIQDFGVKVASKPFEPVLPPALIRTEVFDAMDRLEPREDRYKIEGEELWLQGSAEHTLGPMHMEEILPAEQLPLRLVGFLTSFRREAGTYGKDTEGIIRMHQFDKLEMESFTSPQHGLEEHKFMVAVQEYLMRQLKLPYRALNKCTADIGKPNASGWDLEVWLPGHGRYLETHTADFMTDYQARRLNTRTRTEDGETVFVHTNDATAFAMGRTIVGILENYQTKEGKITIPEVLRAYMNGQTTL